MDESSLCTRTEYDGVFERRLTEGQLQLGSLAMLFFEIYHDDDQAVKQAARIRRIGGQAAQLRGVKIDIDLLDEDLQTMASLPGVMHDGIWNVTRGDVAKPLIVTLTNNTEIYIGNGCVTEYGDPFDNELERLLSLDLASS